MAAKIATAVGGDIAGKTVGVLGLTFKPNTDDMRDAPSLDIVPALQAMGARVQAYDPEGHEARRLLKGVTFAEDAYAAAKGADALVIITEWNAFRALDLGRIKGLMKRAVLVDLRNIYSPDDMRDLGYHYVSVGRPDCAGPVRARRTSARSAGEPVELDQPRSDYRGSDLAALRQQLVGQSSIGL